MANILLVGKYSVIEPLGLMFLAGALKEDGHSVGIHLIEDPDSSALIHKAHDDNNYEYLAFSVYTGYHNMMFRKASVLRDGNFKIIMGGPHMTYFGNNCLDKADWIVAGEGLRSIRNICSGKVKHGYVFIPYLVREDCIPMPDRKSLYLDLRFRDNKIKNVITSIGCYYNCSYCWSSEYRQLYKENFKVRQRPVSQVIEECLEVKSYPCELIFFQDDAFAPKIDWLNKFANKYKSKINIPFHCQMRPEMVTEDRLKLLKYAGCHGITIAVETANDEVRKNLLNRDGDLSKIYAACRLIKDYGFKLRTEQMLGLPCTTIENELDLLHFNTSINPDIAWVSIFSPFCGTRLGDYCKENGLYDGNNNDLSDSFFANSRLNFDKERLRKTNFLQKIFTTCAKIPDGHVLAKSVLESNDYAFDNWFNKMKNHLYDNCLYKV